MKVSGVVSKVQSGLTTVKTSWGSMTIASTFTPKHLEVGEEVVMQVNENNAVIDVHRKGDRHSCPSVRIGQPDLYVRRIAKKSSSGRRKGRRRSTCRRADRRWPQSRRAHPLPSS